MRLILTRLKGRLKKSDGLLSLHQRTVLLSSFAGDDAAECCFLLMIFVIGSWFISIPILVIYICSAVQAIRHRDYMNNVFLGLYCFNALQLLCVVILSSQL